MSGFGLSAEDLKTRVLSVALWPVDVSLAPPDPSVVASERRRIRLIAKIGESDRAIENLSGYYCFNDLQPGTYTVDVKATGVDHSRYLDTTAEVVVPMSDPANPVVEVPMYPRANYPFDARATLVRGVVIDSVSSAPVETAEVTLVGGTERSRTDARGNFVLRARVAISPQPAVVRIVKASVVVERFVVLVEGTTQNAGTIIL